MEYLYSCHTDTGTGKCVNQDAYVVRAAKINGGVFLLAAVCDGVGGFSYGERASGEVIHGFSDWFDYELPQIASAEEDFGTAVLERWRQLVQTVDRKLLSRGRTYHTRMGTTATTVLFADKKYYFCHVGDCRLYRIRTRADQLTKDHSLVGREVAAGRMTPEEAEQDSRRNVILQCIGAGAEPRPDFGMGEIEADPTYLLCSDGFRHKITADEIGACFLPELLLGPDQMKERQRHLTELAKVRGERDNITVIAIKAVGETLGERYG